MQHDSPTSSVTLSYSVHTYRCLFGVYRFTGGKLVRMTAWPIREHHTSHDRRTGRLDTGLIKRLHYSGNSELTKSASPFTWWLGGPDRRTENSTPTHTVTLSLGLGGTRAPQTCTHHCQERSATISTSLSQGICMLLMYSIMYYAVSCLTQLYGELLCCTCL